MMRHIVFFVLLTVSPTIAYAVDVNVFNGDATILFKNKRVDLADTTPAEIRIVPLKRVSSTTLFRTNRMISGNRSRTCSSAPSPI